MDTKNMYSNIEKIKKSNIADEVFEQLKKSIITKQYPPKAKLPSENELADLFGVSRVSIRAAIQKLVGLDFLETRRGEGTFVKVMKTTSIFKMLVPRLILNSKDHLELLEFRRGIEIEACKLAAKRADAENIQKLKECCKYMEEARENSDFDNYGKYDYEFHFEIAKASKNSVMIEVIAQLKDLYFYHYVELEKYRREKNSKFNFGYKFHDKLIEAIENKDTEYIPYYYENILKANEEMFSKNILK